MRAFVLLAIACAGCAGTSTTRTYSIHQRGLTPGSSGPRSFGPSLRQADFALSFSALGAIRGRSEQTRTAGAPGDIAADKAARFLLAAGLSDHAELGFTLEARPGSLATTLASDISAAGYEESLLIVPGVEARFGFGDPDESRGGFLFELGAVGIPLERELDVSTVITVTRPDGTQTTTRPPNDRRKIQDTSIKVMVRAGPYYTAKLGEHATFTFGGLLANHPTLDGVETVRETCFTPVNSIDQRCSGEADTDVAYVHDVLALTPFVSAAWSINRHLAVAGQLFGTFFTGDALSSAPTAGGELALIIHL